MLHVAHIFAILLLVNASMIGMASPKIRYVGLDREGVLVIAPSFPEFRPALDHLVAGRATSMLPELLADVMPYSILVKNMTPRVIAGLAVLYRGSGETSSPVDALFVLQNVGGPRDRLLRPGEARFLCPVPAVFQVINSPSANARAMAPEARSDARATLSKYGAQPGLTVSLDAVIFEDGEIIGPDVSGLMESLNARARAEQDIRSVIETRDAIRVRQYLEQVLRRPEKPAQSRAEVDRYDLRMRELAQRMLQVLSESESQLWLFLNRPVESRTIFRRK